MGEFLPEWSFAETCMSCINIFVSSEDVYQLSIILKMQNQLCQLYNWTQSFENNCFIHVLTSICSFQFDEQPISWFLLHTLDIR